MARWWVCGLLSLLGLAAAAAAAEGNAELLIRLPTQRGADVAAAPAPAPSAAAEEEGATRWAVLVAGSSGYGNYRHQVRLPISPFLCTLN
jgi:legumain